MKKKIMLFCLFLGVFAMNLASQGSKNAMCTFYSTEDGSIEVLSVKQISNNKKSPYTYEVVIESYADKKIVIRSCEINGLIEFNNTPIGKKLNGYGGILKFTCTTNKKINASDVSVTAKICS